MSIRRAAVDSVSAVFVYRSLGCTVVEMLTGNPPWHELEGVAAIFKIATEMPPIGEVSRKVSSAAADFLALCFQRDKDNRPSAKDLCRHAFVSGKT